MLGYAEELEFFQLLEPSEFERSGGFNKETVIDEYLRCARETCDHYIDDVSTVDGITYWDDGAPQLRRLGDWRLQPAEPCNSHEPVDASASAIAAQGLLRLGRYLGPDQGSRSLQAGLSVARTLFDEPYLSVDTDHQGLCCTVSTTGPIAGTMFQRVKQVAQGESSMWGDYHMLELALLLHRLGVGRPIRRFLAEAQS